MSKKLLDKLGWTIQKSSDMALVVADGRKAVALGEMVAVVVTLGGADIPIDMIVTDSDTYDVILGMNWLALAQANILVNESKMIIKSHGLEHEITLHFDHTPRNPSNNSSEEYLSEDESQEEAVYTVSQVSKNHRKKHQPIPEQVKEGPYDTYDPWEE